MGWSVGGGGCLDYQTIWSNFVVNGSISFSTVLYQNFVALKQQFPFVDFVDFDCEEFFPDYIPIPALCLTEALIAFGNMLKEIGFTSYSARTIRCRIGSRFWRSCTLQNPRQLRWMNLQCYDGGAGTVHRMGEGGQRRQGWESTVRRLPFPAVVLQHQQAVRRFHSGSDAVPVRRLAKAVEGGQAVRATGGDFFWKLRRRPRQPKLDRLQS